MLTFTQLLRISTALYGIIPLLFISPVFASASEKPGHPSAAGNIVYEKYQAERNVFIVKAPRDWAKKEKDFPYAYTKTDVCGVELSGPKNKDGARLTISVLYYEYGQFFRSAEDYIGIKKGTYTRIAPEKDVPVANTSVAGRKAKQFEIEIFELVMLPFYPPAFREGIEYEIVPPSKKVTIREKFIVAPAEKGFYVLQYHAPEDMADEYEQVFTMIMSSFEPHEK